MIGFCFRFLAVVLAVVGSAAALPAKVESPPANYWVFEGEVFSKDLRLSTLADEDLIFSGSMAIPVFAPRASGDLEAGERFFDAAKEFEFTLDRFHLLEYQGFQSDGWQWIDLVPGADGEDDQLFMLFPVYGSLLGDSGWQVSWAQFGIRLERGTITPTADWLNWGRALDWKSGWFRLFLSPESGNDEALIEGLLNSFQPAGEPVAPEQQIAELQAVIANMAQRLISVEQENARLSSALAAEQQRVAGMTRTLDRMFEEREAWQDERERLKANQLAEDDEWRQREAEWQVALALKEESFLAIRDEREHAELAVQDLTLALSRMEQERDNLQDLIERWQTSGKGNAARENPPVLPEDNKGKEFRIISDEVTWEYLDESPSSDQRIRLNTDADEPTERVVPRRRGPRGRL